MHVVALRRVAGDPAVLAGVMGVTPYDARQQLHGPGPRILATFADPDDARRLVAALGDAGFDALHVDLSSEVVEVVPRTFTLRPGGIQVMSRDGLPLAIRFDRIQVLLRGTRMQTAEHTEVVRKRKFSLERAVLTGGLMMTRTDKKEVRRVVDQREGFLYIRTAGVSAVELRESELLYDGLGQLREPTRTGNFTRLATIIRDASPKARWDDRMLSRAGQLEVLGTVLTPEDDLDVATAVLDSVLRDVPDAAA